MLCLVSCSLITIEIRDEGAFHWLMLPTVEIFLLSSFLSQKEKSHFLTNYYESKYLESLAYKVTETLLRYSTFSKCHCYFSGGHFPTCRDLLQLVLQLFRFSITGHFHIYLFQPNLPSFFACSSIPVMTDWQAEKGKSKFTIRKEWDFFFYFSAHRN